MEILSLVLSTRFSKNVEADKQTVRNIIKVMRDKDPELCHDLSFDDESNEITVEFEGTVPYMDFLEQLNERI